MREHPQGESMGVRDILGTLKDKAQIELASANEQVDVLRTLETEIDAEKKNERDAGFDEGLAQVSAPGEKVYSAEELEAEMAPLKADIQMLKDQLVVSETKGSTLELQIAELQGQVADAKDATDAELAAAGKAAVEAFKVQVRAAYKAQQDAESMAEGEVDKMFEPAAVVVEPQPEPTPEPEPIPEPQPEPIPEPVPEPMPEPEQPVEEQPVPEEPAPEVPAEEPAPEVPVEEQPAPVEEAPVEGAPSEEASPVEPAPQEEAQPEEPEVPETQS